MEETKTELKLKNKKYLRNTLIIAGVLIVLYVVLSIVFENRFFIGTRINGIDASFASAETMKKRISKAAQNYEMLIESKGSAVDSIKGTDIDLDVNTNNTELNDFINNQDGFLWPVKLFAPDDYLSEKIVTYNNSKLQKLIASKPFANEKNPKRAKDATYRFKDDEFKIIAERYGTQVDVRELCRKLKNRIYKLQPSVDLVEDELYVQPKVKKDNSSMISVVEELNEVINTTIEYEEGFVIEKKDIAGFLDTSNRFKYEINKEAVKRYVDKLDEQYTTVGKPKKLRTSYGNSVEVPAGNYGWKVDKEAEYEKLLTALEKKKDVKREIEYTQKAATHGENDFGDSYVEVNLSKQHIFLYIDGRRVVDSDFVSGNLARGHGTHTGAYKIAYCARNAVLRGDDYSTPVNYWMPFNGGEGLHDATWRGSFGGDIFRTSGSHGCVNLPYNTAKTIFENVEAGFPVLVYSTGGTDNTYTDVYQVVKSKINAIGEVTPERLGYIAKVRREYEKLSDDQKALVDNLGILEEAEYILSTMGL